VPVPLNKIVFKYRAQLLIFVVLVKNVLLWNASFLLAMTMFEILEEKKNRFILL
jgi:hypothetical protein